MALALILLAPSAHAQGFIFSGTATGGSIDIDGDGVSDGTWAITHAGQDSATASFPAEGGVGFDLNSSSFSWDLQSDFSVNLGDPDITYQLTVYANNGSGQTFVSKFGSYEISWVGNPEPATVVSPDPTELASVVPGPNNVTLEQGSDSIPGTTFCNANGGTAIRNNCLDWYVSVPNGILALRLTALNGGRLEGFRFGLESFADLKVNKTVSDTSLTVGETGSFYITVENSAVSGYSASINTSLIDVLPSGVTFVRADATTDGANPGGSYDEVTGKWDIGKLDQAETATLQIDFTVDSAAAPTAISNVIDPLSVTSTQTDPNDNNGPMSAMFNVTIPSADLSITKTNTPGVNGEVDQAFDTLTSGDTTTYTLTAMNNGPDGVTSAVVTDVIGSGLTCAASNPVNISGDGIPTGIFTVSDLTGAGITLGPLEDTEAAVLSYDCTVD